MLGKSSPFDRSPLYRQIADEIAADILAGCLEPGQALPPIRQMASRYRVNPNTVQRSLEELKRGRLVTKQGQRLAVTQDCDLICRFKQQQARKLVESFLLNMRQLGYTQAEMRSILQDFIETSR